jgi:trimeric autotransporter adhesin
MQRKPIARWLMPAGPALVAVLMSGGLAGGGPAAAAARPGGPAPHGGPAGTISTVAGGVGGPALATRLDMEYPWAEPTGQAGPVPCGATYAGGALYLEDQVSVWKVNPSTGLMIAVAGTNAPGVVGDGHSATKASVYGGCGVAVDRAGNLVVTDVWGGNRVEVVAESTGTFYGQAMKRGDIYTIAGNGVAGFSGDGGPATKAALNGPVNLTTDPFGNVVITDRDNNRIRVVADSTGTFYGQSMTAGDIYTIAGNGQAGGGGDGGPATSAQLNNSNGVTFDPNGNLAIADGYNNEVRLVAEHTGTFYGQSMTAGDIYTIAGNGCYCFSGDGVPATSTGVGNPQWVTYDAAGNMLIADWGNSRIRVVAANTGVYYGQSMTAGDIYTIAGDGQSGTTGNGGLATRAELSNPNSVTVDGAGNVVIGFVSQHSPAFRIVAEHTGRFYGQHMTAGDIYNLAGNNGLGCCTGVPATHGQLPLVAGVGADQAGDIAASVANRVWLVPASTGVHYGQQMTGGHLYPVAGSGLAGDSGNGSPAAQARLHSPQGLTMDAAGNLVIADTGNNQVRVVAASTGTFYGQAMTAGDIYTLAGDGEAGYLGDGGPATGTSLSGPAGVSVDAAGNLVIADTGNNRIRVVAASTGTFYGQAMTAGDIYTVAGTGEAGYSGDGGPATSAEVDDPAGVSVDGAGNLVIADTGNNRIRVVAASTGTFYGQAMTAGDIYTVAGTGDAGFSGDGGPATSAEVDDPAGVSVDGAGNLVIADTGNNRIRVVAASTGTFYGQAMTAGDIYTIAGNGRIVYGHPGFSGDGGPATHAELNHPVAVWADRQGNVLIADLGNSRIREITG